MFYTSVVRYGNSMLYRGYDSAGKRVVRKDHFQPEFFVNTQFTPPNKISYDSTANIRSQIPFNIIVAAQQEKDGTAIRFSPHFEGGSNKQSIIERYDMVFSEQLAKCFDKAPPTIVTGKQR